MGSKLTRRRSHDFAANAAARLQHHGDEATALFNGQTRQDVLRAEVLELEVDNSLEVEGHQRLTLTAVLALLVGLVRISRHVNNELGDAVAHQRELQRFGVMNDGQPPKNADTS
jgi:hypothetical protein